MVRSGWIPTFNVMRYTRRSGILAQFAMDAFRGAPKAREMKAGTDEGPLEAHRKGERYGSTLFDRVEMKLYPDSSQKLCEISKVNVSFTVFRVNG